MAEFTQDMLGTAAGTVGVSEQEIPLAMRMAGAAPGILTAAGFMNFRGSNTLIKGGRFDYLDSGADGLKGRKARRIQSKYRVFDSDNVISPMNTRQYYGGAREPGRIRKMLNTERISINAVGDTIDAPMIKQSRGVLGRRAAHKAAGTGSTFNLRSSMASFRPTAMGRHGSLTSFMDPKMGIYSPYSIAGIGSNFNPIRNRMAGALEKLGVTDIAPGETLMGPGLLSFISAGTRIDRLERKALRGNQRALNKLGRVDRNIENLLSANNPQLLKPKVVQGTTVGASLQEANRLRWAQRAGGMSPSEYMEFTKVTSISYADSPFKAAMGSAVSGKGVGQVGVRNIMLGAAMPGKFGQAAYGYVHGARGGAAYAALAAEKLGDNAALVKGAQKAVSHLAGSGATKYMATGAKLAGLALPGLNVLAAASLVYDLGNIAGEIFKSGINLARDATKSMQGSINKPLFGMGYKDTEAAATSRQRGVMAIQNSRLNARSMLGSEAGMLAARYG